MIGKISPTLSLGISQVSLVPSLANPEPWMADFVKGRHSQEEWDAFFAYCAAGPFTRLIFRLVPFLISALPRIR